MYLTLSNIRLKIYELDPTYFLSTSGLAWQATLKKNNVKLDLLTDINMLLMVEKGLTGRICHAIYRYVKASNKHMKNYDRNKGSSYLKYWGINLYGWAMSQKLPANDFKWVEETSQFNEDFMKSYNDDSNEIYFFQVDVQYLENLHNLHNDLLFFPKRMKIEKN